MSGSGLNLPRALRATGPLAPGKAVTGRIISMAARALGAQQSGSPSNSLHRLGHSPQNDFSWQSALHIPDLEHTHVTRSRHIVICHEPAALGVACVLLALGQTLAPGGGLHAGGGALLAAARAVTLELLTLETRES